MKKLIILLSLIALLASGMAFAQVTFTGQIEYEAATSLESGVAWGTTGQNFPNITNERYFFPEPDARILVNVKADDYTTGTFRFRTIAFGNEAVRWDRAFFVTDFAKVYKLPIGWQGVFGYNEYSPAHIANLGWDTTKKVLGRFANGNDYYFDAKYWGTEQVITIEKMVRLAAFFSLGNDRLKDMYIDAVVNAPAGPGTFGVEAAYLLWGSSNKSLFGGSVVTTSDYLVDIGEGTMMFGLAYKGIKAGDIGIDFGGAYYLPLEKKITYSVYGANVKASLGSLASFLVGIQGIPEDNDDLGIKAQMLHNVRFAVGVTPVPVVSFDVGVLLYTGGEDKNFEGDDREVFNTLDVSACVKAGKASFRFGYLFVAEKDVSIDPYMTDAIKKSLYFIARLDF